MECIIINPGGEVEDHFMNSESDFGFGDDRDEVFDMVPKESNENESADPLSPSPPSPPRRRPGPASKTRKEEVLNSSNGNMPAPKQKPGPASKTGKAKVDVNIPSPSESRTLRPRPGTASKANEGEVLKVSNDNKPKPGPASKTGKPKPDMIISPLPPPRTRAGPASRTKVFTNQNEDVSFLSPMAASTPMLQRRSRPGPASKTGRVPEPLVEEKARQDSPSPSPKKARWRIGGMKLKEEKKQKPVAPVPVPRKSNIKVTTAAQAKANQTAAKKNKKGRKKRPASRSRASATVTATSHDPNKEYEVEEIVDYVDEVRTGESYLVKWKGYSHQQNTWEPPSNLGNCTAALIKFYELRKAVVQAQIEKGQKRPWDIPPDPRQFISDDEETEEA